MYSKSHVFEGSILAYNPALNEAKWVPAHGLANDLSWTEERSAVALANYVPSVPMEAAQIARLGVSQVVSCPSDDSSTMSMEGDESWVSDAPSINPPMDTDHKVGEESKEPLRSMEEADRWMNPADEAERNAHNNQCQCPRNWEAIMEESERLAYDDPRSSSDATIMGVDSPPRPQLSSQDESENSLPNTPRPLAHRGHPWNKCCHWCPKLPPQHLAWTQLWPMCCRLSWVTCKLEAHIWASPEHGRLQPITLDLFLFL